jgi:hypothetical protein
VLPPGFLLKNHGRDSSTGGGSIQGVFTLSRNFIVLTTCRWRAR